MYLGLGALPLGPYRPGDIVTDPATNQEFIIAADGTTPMLYDPHSISQNVTSTATPPRWGLILAALVVGYALMGSGGR